MRNLSVPILLKIARLGFVIALFVYCPALGGFSNFASAQEPAEISPISTARKQHLAVVLDDSGSMAESLRGQRRLSRMGAAKRALRAAIAQLPPETELGIVRLNGTRDGSPWVVPFGPLDVSRAQSAVLSVEAEGGTPLGEFMKIAADELLKARQQQHYGEYRLLLVTDGEANDPELVETFLPQIMARGLSIHVIGVDMDQDHSLATRVHSYRSANDETELTQAVQEVFAETGGSGSDTDQEAFELLAPLDSEVASAMLTALAETGNEPLDRNAPPLSDEDISGAQGNFPASKNKDRIPIIAFVIVLFGFFLLKNIFKANRRSRN
jgi:von Willebrand factor type A domain